MSTPLHAPLLFETRAGHLHIGGVPVTALAERLGTPFYAYELRLIRQRIQDLREHLPAAMQLHYALKANPFPPLVSEMAKQVDGCDVASAGELELALEAGFAPGTISFAGPGKRDAELEAALRAGIVVHVESAGELHRLTRLGERQGIAPRIALRLNPPFELKGSGMRMGGGAKPFGIDAELAPKIIREINDLGLELQGLHIFAGSQCLNLQAIVQALSASLELGLGLLQEQGIEVQYINLGGGLGIPYFPGEQRLDIKALGEELHHLLEVHAGGLGAIRPILELGRFLVGEAGAYVTRIIDRKSSRGEVFLITDGGMHQHLALSGQLGQVIRKNYPVYLAHRAEGPEDETLHIHGPLCTPLDVLGKQVALPRAEVGDLLVITQSGAYGLSASPLHFLAHPLPAEVLL